MILLLILVPLILCSPAIKYWIMYRKGYWPKPKSVAGYWLWKRNIE